jgi:hypothetical protein
MSWGDGTEVPSAGKNLVIVGTDEKNLLHIRFFDQNGNRVTDTDETKLPRAQARAILTLKKQLSRLLPPHVMTDAEKERVLRETASIAGFMIPCELVEESPKNTSLNGTTLFTKEDCITPTAVYLSKANDRKSVANVIVFFHGFHVANIEKNVFGPDTAGGENKLREGVDAAAKDVVLIVPFLGHKEIGSGTLELGNLEKKGIKAYLDQVLGLIISGKDSTSIERLVLACHSGSDKIQRDATGLLGADLKKKLKECWGFDCINSDADKDFGPWADGLPGVSFYFYVANGSIDYGHFPSHLKRAYGTPGSPKKPPMAKVFLAPAVNAPRLDSVPDDEISETFDAIQKKRAPSDYEKLRLKLDKQLDEKSKGAWETEAKKHVLKEHYEVVRDLFKVRIGRLFAGKP